eukprot:15353014-Ditylum_brightwellii.AAC.1
MSELKNHDKSEEEEYENTYHKMQGMEIAHDSFHSRLPPPPDRFVQNAAKKRTGVFGTTANLVNTIVGAGIIGMPYAVRQS